MRTHKTILDNLRNFETSDDLGNGDFSLLYRAAEYIDLLNRCVISLLKDLPQIRCDMLHHTKRDFHSSVLPCPVEDRITKNVCFLSTLVKGM